MADGTERARPLRHLTVLGHGGERTGPPVHLARVLAWAATARPDLDVDVVLLDDGPLVADLAARARVHVVGPAPTRPVPGLAPADVVLVNTAGSIAALPALPGPPAALVTHVHELETGFGHHLAAPLRRLVLDRSDLLLSVSGAVTAMLVGRYGVAPERVRPHAAVVDPAALAAAAADPVAPDGPAGELSVVACGTLDWRKGPDHLVAVAHRVRAAGVAARFTWVGGDPDGAVGRRVRAAAAELGLEGTVRFVGERPDALRWLAGADVVVVPSREDAYPLVGVEAAGLGRPVACFAAGGLPELLGDDAGVVVPYPDLDALAAAVVALAGDPGRRRALGAVGAARVRARHAVEVAGPLLLADLAAAVP